MTMVQVPDGMAVSTQGQQYAQYKDIYVNLFHIGKGNL